MFAAGIIGAGIVMCGSGDVVGCGKLIGAAKVSGVFKTLGTKLLAFSRGIGIGPAGRGAEEVDYNPDSLGGIIWF